ncbi:MAG: hypothetical protein ACRCYT_02320 [Cetobacterium sp.]
MKISKVLTNNSTGVVGQLDNTATKVVLTALDSIKNCKQEIVMAGLGLALAAFGDGLELDSDFMSSAVDGQFDITDLGAAANEIGMGMVGLAAVTASQKINEKFEELSCIDDMGDDDFEAFLNGGCDVSAFQSKATII